jgi:hypothetical protein
MIPLINKHIPSIIQFIQRHPDGINENDFPVDKYVFKAYTDTRLINLILQTDEAEVKVVRALTESPGR